LLEISSQPLTVIINHTGFDLGEISHICSEEVRNKRYETKITKTVYNLKLAITGHFTPTYKTFKTNFAYQI